MANATNLDAIKNLVAKSFIPVNQHADLMEVFSHLSDEDLGSLIIMISDNPSILIRLSDNLEAKKIALGEKDADMWKKIIEEEVQWLQNVE